MADGAPARLRHIVFFRARRREDVAAMFDGLKALEKIPHALRLEVALNRKIDRLGNEIDVVVHGEFAGDAELAAYKAHPIYGATIEIVRPLRDQRWAVDYLISEE